MFKTDNDDVEKVGAGKMTLAIMAYIVLVIGAITMIVNFGVGFKDDTEVTEWYQLVPVILETIVGLLTYTVFTIVSFPFVKGKGKKKKEVDAVIAEAPVEEEPVVAEPAPITDDIVDDGKKGKKGKNKNKKKVPAKKVIYWVSVAVAYLFVIVPFIMDVVEYAKAVQGD